VSILILDALPSVNLFIRGTTYRQGNIKETVGLKMLIFVEKCIYTVSRMNLTVKTLTI
jgi:hypothetical protein